MKKLFELNILSLLTWLCVSGGGGCIQDCKVQNRNIQRNLELSYME